MYLISNNYYRINCLVELELYRYWDHIFYLLHELIIIHLSSSTNIELDFIKISIEQIIWVFFSHWKKQLVADGRLSDINCTVLILCLIPIHLCYHLAKRVILQFITKIDIIPLSIHVYTYVYWTILYTIIILRLSLEIVSRIEYLNS